MPWERTSTVRREAYSCGHCGHRVAPDQGYNHDGLPFRIRICPNCDRPTFFDGGSQAPGTPYGRGIEHLPDNIAALYEETRQCMSVESYTAAVLCSRKLLMNIAVSQSAPEGGTFVSYVDYLTDNHYVPPDCRDWVDEIRQRGNQANHEITMMSREDAETLINFLEMLMAFIYEFPGKLSRDDDQ